ncbi:hypothetical protein GCU49_06975 [Modestobacter roseus]|nr:hypothetical protein [Modestobacter roseus]
MLSWVQPDGGDAVRVPTGAVDDLPVGATVEVTVGRAVHDDASAGGLEPARDVLAAEVLAAPEPVPTAPAAGTVNHPVTVVLVQPAGTQRSTSDATIDQVAAVVDGPVADFWAEQSRGAVRFGVTGRVDWITTSATCSEPLRIWEAAAAAAGWRGLAAEHLLVYVPRSATGCAFGLGSVGRSVGEGGVSYVRDTLPSVISHEFGHNMGLGHASSVRCDATVDSGSCRTIAYDDWYDVMGFSWEQMGTLSTTHADRLGLLPVEERAVVEPWAATAGFTLAPVSATSGTRAIQLRAPDGASLWLEYRAATGRDTWLGSQTANRLRLDQGVVLRQRGDQPDTSLLLDGTPSPASGWSADEQVALPVGRSLAIARAEVTITVTRVDAASATVTVSPGATPIGRRYADAGGPTGSLGAPTAGQRCGLRASGCFQEFRGGAIYWSPGTGARVVSGAVRDRWAATGWENGSLGYPVTDTVCGLVGGGCYQHFERGTVMSGPAGAWSVSGAVRDGWFARGSEGGVLGYPAADQVCGLPGGGCFQRFQSGSLYWSPATGARSVAGPTAEPWARQGWERGPLGYPVTDPVCGLRDGGCYQHFQGGTAMSSPATGAWPISGALRDGWFRTGSEAGLGYPTSAAVCGLRDGGCLQRFQRGTLYASARTPARVVTTPASDAWARQGWEGGALGYPLTDTVCGLRDGGCYQHFQGGTVMYSPSRGSWPLSGALREGWFRLGSEGGVLGYPVAGPVCGLRDAGCLQRFAGGALYWSPATGARAVVPGAIGDRWAGLGWEGGLGYPLDEERSIPEGRAQRFQLGTLVWDRTTGQVRRV